MGDNRAFKETWSASSFADRRTSCRGLKKDMRRRACIGPSYGGDCFTDGKLRSGVFVRGCINAEVFGESSYAKWNNRFMCAIFSYIMTKSGITSYIARQISKISLDEFRKNLGVKGRHKGIW